MPMREYLSVFVLIAAGQTSANDPVCRSPDGRTEYIMQGVNFIAQDVQTHEQKWTFPLHPATKYDERPSCLQKMGGSQVYIGNTSYDGPITIIGLESATGKKLWDITIKYGGVVNFREKGVPPQYAMFDITGPAGGCGGIYVRDHKTGKHWTRQMGGDLCPPSLMGNIPDGDEDYSVFIGDGSTVGIDPTESSIHRLDASDGREQWTFHKPSALNLNPDSLMHSDNNKYTLFVDGYQMHNGNPIPGQWKLNATTGEQIGDFVPSSQTLIV